MSSLFHTYTFSEDLNTAVHIASLCMHSHSHYYIYHTSFQSLHLFTHPSHTIPILVKKYLSAYIAHHIVALSPVFSIHSECILIQGRYPLYGTSRCLLIQCFMWSKIFSDGRIQTSRNMYIGCLVVESDNSVIRKFSLACLLTLLTLLTRSRMRDERDAKTWGLRIRNHGMCVKSVQRKGNL